MGLFGLGNLVHIPPNPKNGFRGVKGVGGRILGTFSHIFGAFFLNWSDKKVQKIKKFKKGHISIPKDFFEAQKF